MTCIDTTGFAFFWCTNRNSQKHCCITWASVHTGTLGNCVAFQSQLPWEFKAYIVGLPVATLLVSSASLASGRSQPFLDTNFKAWVTAMPTATTMDSLCGRKDSMIVNQMLSHNLLMWQQWWSETLTLVHWNHQNWMQPRWWLVLVPLQKTASLWKWMPR